MTGLFSLGYSFATFTEFILLCTYKKNFKTDMAVEQHYFYAWRYRKY